MELLIVVGVIGVLVASAVFAYSRVTKSGRDARRRADIQMVAQAIDQYYLENDQTYPLDPDCDGVEVFLQAGNMPNDPDLTKSYDFGDSCSVDEYCVCALMEVEGSGNAYGRAGTICSWAGGESRDYYCISSKQ